jgi:hypothetical protein
VSQGLVDGRFHIGCVIGRGNMQEADEAEGRMPPRALRNAPSPQDGRAQPIDTASSTRAMQRFAREVPIMRRLRHPDLTRLIAGGTATETVSVRTILYHGSGGQYTAGLAAAARTRGVARSHRPLEEQQ